VEYKKENKDKIEQANIICTNKYVNIKYYILGRKMLCQTSIYKRTGNSPFILRLMQIKIPRSRLI